MASLRTCVVVAGVIAAACVLNGRLASACGTSGVFSVSDTLNAFGAESVFDLSGGADNGTFLLYSKDEVRNHFADQVTQPPVKFVNSRSTTFACVDARGDASMLGTPGGDMGEMVAAIIAWFKMENKPFNKADVKALFNKFMTNVVTPSRPFFFHTDDNRLRRMFVRLNQQSIKPKPSKLPDVGPSNAVDANKWLAELINFESQGCGHIRLQLDPAFKKYFSVKRSGVNVTNCDGVAPADCIDATEVASEVITLFWNYWWFSPPGSDERKKIRLVVDVGPLVGKAVAIVAQTDYSGTCQSRHPLIFPNQGGSTLFVYHGNAVTEMRDFAVRRGDLAPPGAKRARLIKLWNEVGTMQLGATLTYLNPANSIGLFQVTLNTTGGAPLRKMKM